MSRASCLLAVTILIVSYSGRVLSQTTNPNSQAATNGAAAKDPLRHVALASPPASAEAKQLYEEGVKLCDEGQFPQAVEKFQQAIRNDNEYADAYSALGRTYFKMRQWQNAIDNLRRAATLNAKQGEQQAALHQKLLSQPTEMPVPAKENLKTVKISPPKLNLVGFTAAQIKSSFVASKVKTPSIADAPKPVEVQPVATKTEQPQQAIGSRVSFNVTPTAQPLETKSAPTLAAKPSAENLSLTKIYRVGPGDVIDVRLNDTQSPTSTLFTITSAGFLEHPALADPLPVSGLTVEEIATKIEDDLKRRAIVEQPRAVVAVRDYTSHSVLVSGLVKDSGTKFLRREAIPLYVVVADAQPLPEATKVTVVRTDSNQIYDIDLAQAAEMNLLVRPGDVITLQPSETQFIYIGGEVKLPGEKTFRRGLTLTQAIITAGGVEPKAKVAQIDRDDGRGFLVGTRFTLKEIATGKTADPALRPGDRITISR